MRLIDADALLLHLADYQLQESPDWGANGYGNKDAYEAITECIRAVEEAPTIDAESLITQHEDIGYERGYRDGYAEALEVTDNAELVKHGHWIDPAAADCYRCSVCEEYTLMEMPRLLYHYCPNCGSKMDVSDTDVRKKEEKE